jgi:hypothetical protein
MNLSIKVDRTKQAGTTNASASMKLSRSIENSVPASSGSRRNKSVFTIDNISDRTPAKNVLAASVVHADSYINEKAALKGL